MSVRLSGSRLAAGVGHHPIAATALAATAPDDEVERKGRRDVGCKVSHDSS